MPKESDGGRFALYKVKSMGYTSRNKIDMWATVEDEFVFWDEKPKVTVHLKSNLDESVKNGELKYDWWHWSPHKIADFNIAPGETKSVPFEPVLGASPIYNRLLMESLVITYLYDYYNSRLYQTALKGIDILFPRTKSTISIAGSPGKKVGEPISYQVNTTNKTGKAITVGIKLAIEQMRTGEICFQHSTTASIGTNASYNYSGTFTPTDPMEPGVYGFKLEVQKPDGKKENRYMGIGYHRSRTDLRFEGYFAGGYGFPTSLVAGREYKVSFMIKNYSYFDITNGKYTLLVENESGRVVSDKEVGNLYFSAGELKHLSDTFVFNPVDTGKYTVRVIYSDETRAPGFETEIKRGVIFRRIYGITFDKLIYNYLDTAKPQLVIRGVGEFHVDVSCPASGLAESFDIEIAEGAYVYTKEYEIPLLSNGVYYIRVQVTDQTGKVYNRTVPINKNPLRFFSTARFGTMSAMEGNPVPFELRIWGAGGAISPVTGVLTVSSGTLDFHDTKTVTLQPVEWNLFNYDIPIPEAAAAGVHQVDYQLLVDNEPLITSSKPVEIPPPYLLLPVPPQNLDAGGSTALNYTNLGGRHGLYDIDLKLRDNKGKIVLAHSRSFDIPAGEKAEVNITIPTVLNTGNYILFQEATHTLTGKQFSTYNNIEIKGLETGLNSYTLKEKFFDNENVAGKSEINNGPGEIADGLLRAKILRHVKTTSGVEEQEPGNYIDYNMIEAGFDTGEKLFLSTDIGIVEYDKTTGDTKLLYDPGYNCNDIIVTGAGEIWVGTYSGMVTNAVLSMVSRNRHPKRRTMFGGNVLHSQDRY